MGAVVVAVLVAALSCACGSGAPEASRTGGTERADGPHGAARAMSERRRLIVVGLDAADGRLIDAGIAAARLPNFARMVREGVSGPLRTHRPILSPIVWTTIATGLTPDRHGVLDFVETDAAGRTLPVTSYARRAPAFWDILEERGTTCGIVGWLATYPAQPIHGFMISDRFTIHPFTRDETQTREDLPGRTYPPQLAKELKDTLVSPSEITDADLQSVFGARKVPVSEDRSERRELRVIEAVARTYEQAALRMDREAMPDLLAVYFEAIDRLMHLFGGAMPPPLPGTSRSDADRYGHVVEALYAAMDVRLGRFMEAAGETGAVLVISDHGFKIGDERPRHPALRSDVFAAEWHRDPGVILAWGRGVRRGARLADADVYDVAPTILAYFGRPAGQSMRGRVLSDIFEPGVLAPSGPKVPDYVLGSATAGGAAAVQPGAAKTSEGSVDSVMMENLRALGYIGATGGAQSQASTNLATFYLDDKQFDRAIAIYKDILAKDPADLTALYNLGYAYKGLGALAPAAECFARLLRVRPDYLEARLVLSDCYVSMGKPQDALDLLQTHAREGRDDAGYQNHLGTVLASAGRLDEAAGALARAITLRPGEPSAYMNLSRVQLARGDRRGAIATLERAQREAPGDPRPAARLRQLASGADR